MVRGRGPFAGGPEQAQRQLLKAAEECFLRYGVRRTTMDDVGRTAGVSRPTLYRYFRDRDSLVLAVISRRSRAFSSTARAFLDERASFRDKLVDGLVLLINAGRADPITSSLVRPETLSLTSDVLAASSVTEDITLEIWRPVFEQAQLSGEMREDIDVPEVCAWLADVVLTIVAWQDKLGLTEDGLRAMMSDFVVPSLVS